MPTSRHREYSEGATEPTVNDDRIVQVFEGLMGMPFDPRNRTFDGMLPVQAVHRLDQSTGAHGYTFEGAPQNAYSAGEVQEIADLYQGVSALGVLIAAKGGQN